ncbi:hypothetical protein [Streptomyces beihaiensis]|uniref:Uncharacterized protein n=1 Tax=Streptomyces beihaiensis TaxID=2984495 RepID=A0ABT3U6Z4_9ACTN|nr:hypothetical protein [Streptomyces beihaiensis]MCX3063970.1 hypothetical protein [Streptomyces beihaiensis]
MPATTHAKPHPAATGGARARLPWWAVALPAVAFVVLLALLLNPADAHASAGDPHLVHLMERARELLRR